MLPVPTMGSAPPVQHERPSRMTVLTACTPCERALFRRGRHRAHGCAGQTYAGTVAILCACTVCHPPLTHDDIDRAFGRIGEPR